MHVCIIYVWLVLIYQAVTNEKAYVQMEITNEILILYVCVKIKHLSTAVFIKLIYKHI